MCSQVVVFSSLSVDIVQVHVCSYSGKLARMLACGCDMDQDVGDPRDVGDPCLHPCVLIWTLYAVAGPM
jgi:hypothetical protein